MVRLKSVGNFVKAMDHFFYELILPLQFLFFSGKMPVFRDWLRVIVITSIRGSLIYCNNCVDNPSRPVLCLGFSLLQFCYLLAQREMSQLCNFLDNGCKIC